MPNEILPWNEENLCKVVTDLFTKAVRDQALHQRLMTDPYGVLSERIEILPSFQKNFFAKPQGSYSMTLNVPPFQGEDTPATDAATTPVKADYTIYCTTFPW